jgi:holliday junction DNA helicase RuvA
MFDYITGTLAEKNPAHVTIEAGGVGYFIFISLISFEKLPDVGKQTKLYTYYQVREDAHALYGFSTQADREVFRKLISVSKIGPKLALNVLSRMSSEELVRAINSGDPGRFKSIPGIGGKTAERLLIELKGKFDTLQGVGKTKSAVSGNLPGVPFRGTSAKGEAAEALMALGYNDREVYKAIDRVAEVIPADSPVEEWVKRALQVV